MYKDDGKIYTSITDEEEKVELQEDVDSITERNDI